jgi:hypothetical protein
LVFKAVFAAAKNEGGDQWFDLSEEAGWLKITHTNSSKRTRNHPSQPSTLETSFYFDDLAKATKDSVNATKAAYDLLWPDGYLEGPADGAPTLLQRNTAQLHANLKDNLANQGFYPDHLSSHNDFVQPLRMECLQNLLKLVCCDDGGNVSTIYNITNTEILIEKEKSYLSKLSACITYVAGIPPRSISIASIKVRGGIDERGIFITPEREVVLLTRSKKNHLFSLTLLPDEIGWGIIYYLVVFRFALRQIVQEVDKGVGYFLAGADIRNWEDFLFCDGWCVPWQGKQFTQEFHIHSNKFFGFPFAGSFMRQLGTRLFSKYLHVLSPQSDETHSRIVAELGGHGVSAIFKHYGRSALELGKSSAHQQTLLQYHYAWHVITGISGPQVLTDECKLKLQKLPPAILEFSNL